LADNLKMRNLNLFVLLFFIYTITILGQQSCTANRNATQVNLQTCTIYSQAACCTIEQDENIQSNLASIGNSNCNNYYKAFLCAQACSPEWAECSPCQLCLAFCNTLLQSCKSYVPIPNLPSCSGLSNTNCTTPSNNAISISLPTIGHYFFVLLFLLLVQL